MSEKQDNGRPYGADLPSGVKHFHGAMYLVPFDVLKLPDPEGSKTNTDKGYEFRNPRSLTERGQADLFDKKKSGEMRDSIKEKTLMTPFVCRWLRGDNKLMIQMVGGERRHRAVDFLRRKKELVKDPRTATLNENMEYEYEYRPADDVYEFVLCKIYAVTDDIEALSLAYTENDCRINQGPGHDIAVVMELRHAGASDEKIMSAMSKDEKWLRDTDTLIEGLGESSLKELIEDRIDREAALELLVIKEKHGDDVAAKALVVAHEASQKDYRKKFDKLTKTIFAARDDEEIAEGDVTAHEYQGGDGVEKAKTKLSEAKSKVSRNLNEREKLKPVTDKGHVKDGIRVVQGESRTPSSLRAAKIKDHYLDTLETLMKKGGRAQDGEYTANLDGLSLAFKLLKGVMTGDTDAPEIIRLHCKGLSGSGLHTPIPAKAAKDDDEDETDDKTENDE